MYRLVVTCTVWIVHSLYTDLEYYYFFINFGPRTTTQWPPSVLHKRLITSDKVWFGQFICVFYAFIWTDPNCFAETCNIKTCDIGIKNRILCANLVQNIYVHCLTWTVSAYFGRYLYTCAEHILLGLCVRVCAFCFRLCDIFVVFSFIFSHVLHCMRAVFFLYVFLCFVCFCLLPVGLFCHKYLTMHTGFLAYHFDDEFFRGSLPLCLRVYATG